jgi:hypothetical protein
VKKTETKVQSLVEMIERGELQLPEMQRGYVWKSTQVRDLLDSLYRGYPSGNILVWETDDKAPLRDMAVAQNASAFSDYKLLLDGQQRLTSLSAIIRGEPVKVRGRQKPIDVLFNLDHPDDIWDDEDTEDDEDNDPQGVDDDDQDEEEESVREKLEKLTFVVASKQLEALPNWVSVTKIFKGLPDGEIMSRLGVTGWNDPRYNKYQARLQRLKQIKEYQYSVQILERDMSYEEVTHVFVRVNSQGAKLRSSDLALARITAKWRGALKQFESVEDIWHKERFSVQLGTLVRALTVEATGQSRFARVGSLSLDDLKSGWTGAVKGMEWAINFARNNCGIESPALLTSPYALLLLAFYCNRRDQAMSAKESDDLRFWLRVANGRGRYSRGSSESYLDADLTIVKGGGDVAVKLLENVRQQFGRLKFDVSEFRGRNQRASLFRLMYQAIKADKAKDWQTGIEISATSAGSDHKLQFHHIFPKAVLKERHESPEINEVANLAFIGGRTNRKISATPPHEYLPRVMDKAPEALTAQCVPTDPVLWRIENYRDFLEARRQLIAARVNAFLGVEPTIQAST